MYLPKPLLFNRSFLVGFFLIGMAGQLHANFDFNQRCIDAYENIFKGKFAITDSLLKIESSIDANNGVIPYISGLNNFIKCQLFDDPALEKQFFDMQAAFINSVENNEESPLKRFALGELYLQKGVMNYRQGNLLHTLFDLRKAYSKLEENIAKYPDFQLSKKSYYAVQTLISSIPDSYKGIVEWMGYGTDETLALSALDSLQAHLKQSNSYGFFQKEVNIYRSFLLLKIEKDEKSALELIKSETLDFATNPVSNYLLGKMAIDCKQTDLAIKVLQHFAGAKCPIAFINYELGNAFLYGVNKQCLLYYAHFIRQTKGSNLLKDTYLKVSWYYFLLGKTERMEYWLSQLRNKGTAIREKDQAAMREAEKFNDLNPSLLKARLLFDGGYYQRAVVLLEMNRQNILSNPKYRLSYYYQLARNQTFLEQYQAAITSFSQATQSEFSSAEYFIPVSYFQIGEIYKNKLNDLSKAETAYRKCLEFKGYPYKNEYDYRCKKALKAIKETTITEGQ